MAHIEKLASKKTWVFWQLPTEEDAPESAIAVEKYIGTICLTQEGRYINISEHELHAFIKLLQKVKNEKID